ncbi:MAG: acyltransferase family protein [Deltaproteobacteria bacterium]|nr:acyltransferase family protein [Deltaproteobacteria bacterium]
MAVARTAARQPLRVSAHGSAAFDLADAPAAAAPAALSTPRAGRLRFVDVAKGMSIVLVAFGHSHLVPMNDLAAEANRVLGLVRMPFFFFLSGLFFRPSKPFGILAREKSDSLLKPYLVTLGLVGLVRVLTAGASPAAQGARVLYGVGTSIDMPWAPLWYLAHLWLVFPCAWVLVRGAAAMRLPRGIRGVLLAASFLVGLSCLHLFRDLPIVVGGLHAPLSGLPFSLDALGITTTYFLLGFALRERVSRFRPNLTLVAALLLVFVAVDGVFHPRLDINHRIADPPLAAAACSLIGIYLGLCAAHVVSATGRLGTAFAFFGFHSLFVLIFHSYFEARCRELLSAVVAPPPGLGTAATAYLASVFLAAGIGVVIRRSAFLSALYLRRARGRSADGAALAPRPL